MEEARLPRLQVRPLQRGHNGSPVQLVNGSNTRHGEAEAGSEHI